MLPDQLMDAFRFTESLFAFDPQMATRRWRAADQGAEPEKADDLAFSHESRLCREWTRR